MTSVLWSVVLSTYQDNIHINFSQEMSHLYCLKLHSNIQMRYYIQTARIRFIQHLIMIFTLIRK